MEVFFYETNRGRSPITDFIEDQPNRDQAVLVAVLDNIQNEGFSAKGANFRQLDGKLWEIKIKAPSGGFRFAYVTIKKEVIYILHAFKKKTPKTPKKELDVARKRLREIL